MTRPVLAPASVSEPRHERERPRFDVTSVGESMIRLSTDPGVRLGTTDTLRVHVAGAESNVCAALASLGREVSLATKLPRGPWGDRVRTELRTWGVGDGGVVTSNEGRVGTYYVELAPPPMPSRVIYDRDPSAFRSLTRDEIDWASLLDTRILHLTGITPALGSEAAEIVAEAARAARSQGVLVSFDVNYRQRLWSQAEAAPVILRLMRQADVVFCSRRDAHLLFGAEGDDEQVLGEVRSRTDARWVVVSHGDEGVIAWCDGATERRPATTVATVIDRIGAGDAMAAGFLDGLLDGDARAGLARGTALAAYALSLRGDVATVSRDELLALADAQVGDVAR